MKKIIITIALFILLVYVAYSIEITFSNVEIEKEDLETLKDLSKSPNIEITNIINCNAVYCKSEFYSVDLINDFTLIKIDKCVSYSKPENRKPVVCLEYVQKTQEEIEEESNLWLNERLNNIANIEQTKSKAPVLGLIKNNKIVLVEKKA